MSVPTTLVIPEGVKPEFIVTPRGTFAAHVVRARNPRGSVLLIPGWTGSKEDFTPILPGLAAAGYDVVAYDQRGQFETLGTPEDDYSLAGLARDALAVAAVALPSAPLHVLGHSFGGLVAQNVVLTDAGRVRTLTLVCSGPGALGDSPSRPLKRLVAALGKFPLLQVHELRERGIKRPAEISAFLARRFVANSPQGLRAFTQILIDTEDRVDDVAETGVPALVVRGADDDAWPFDAQDDMARRLGTEVVVLPRAAHSPAVESPEDLVAVLTPFLHAHP